MMEVKIITDSIYKRHSIRLTTIRCKLPRIVHAELMTHRVFGRNASSSRAIPVMKILKNILRDIARPSSYGQNKPGMQAGEDLSALKTWTIIKLWTIAAYFAVFMSYLMTKVGVHKQVANRITEPFQYITVLITATEWSNFFELRRHETADPTIKQLADMIWDAMEASVPTERGSDKSKASNWHLPYVSDEETQIWMWEPLYLAKLSTARCARTSYLNHDGTAPDHLKDVDLHDRLVVAKPVHASPTEHIAYPDILPRFTRHLKGWITYRVIVENTGEDRHRQRMEMCDIVEFVRLYKEKRSLDHREALLEAASDLSLDPEFARLIGVISDVTDDDRLKYLSPGAYNIAKYVSTLAARFHGSDFKDMDDTRVQDTKAGLEVIRKSYNWETNENQYNPSVNIIDGHLEVHVDFVLKSTAFNILATATSCHVTVNGTKYELR